ncbi:hypothetical protein EVB97_118 [Rhizobium phage RHph_Y65]|uniref:Uncharacterized protein n=1 Tax=Rhizobium phage RHph_Y65 TaxID=2509785 RepID=A0A7S5RBZ2_9CAUD|nr:hypothetical protein PQC17_gp118 [Rhizobium phage RHph_Y65]QIG72676.1 hypothetical protein EVB97_118 [Rhizobium phage RHph_Y65]
MFAIIAANERSSQPIRKTGQETIWGLDDVKRIKQFKTAKKAQEFIDEKLSWDGYSFEVVPMSEVHKYYWINRELSQDASMVAMFSDKIKKFRELVEDATKQGDVNRAAYLNSVIRDSLFRIIGSGQTEEEFHYSGIAR